MTQRTFVNMMLVAVIIPINELHHLWHNVSYNVNPWFIRNYPLDIQWYVKFLCLDVTDVLKAFLLYRLTRMHFELRLAATVYFFYTAFDFIMFFVNFNQDGYLIPYAMTSVVIIVVAFMRKGNYYKAKHQIEK